MDKPRARRWAFSGRVVRVVVESLAALALGLGLRVAAGQDSSMARSVDGFAQKWSRQSTFGAWSSAKRPRSGFSARPGWPALVVRGQTLQPFGWGPDVQGQTFHRAIGLKVAPGIVVSSGPGGRVVALRRVAGAWLVTLSVRPQLRLTVQGLASERVARGERVGAASPLGTAGVGVLEVSLNDQNFPVDPLQPEFFAEGLASGD